MNGRRLRYSRVAGISVLCLLAGLSWPARAQSQAGKTEKAAQQKPEAGKTEEGTPAVRFEVTVFQVAIPKDRIVELDAKKLAAAGPTAAQLAQVLQAFGVTEVLYRVDQAVAADGRRNEVSLSRDAPYATGAPTPDGGTPLARERVGAKLGLTAVVSDATKAQRVQAGLDIEVATFTPSRVQVAPDAPAPAFWHIQQRYGGAMDLGQPVVLLSVDGNTTAGSDDTLGFVSLVRLSSTTP